MNTGTSTPVGVKSSLASTLSPWMTDASVPHGPMRLGPMRRLTKAMTFISKKMFMNAMGTVTTRMMVAAMRNRTMPTLAPSASSDPLDEERQDAAHPQHDHAPR